MLVGLIRPDAGRIFVHGEPVHGGADVLGSVGAFIEDLGFLPHLTGRQNLRAYWAATGRPLAEAHLEEALAIAGLGSALDRKVRGYSHGMRQRLGSPRRCSGCRHCWCSTNRPTGWTCRRSRRCGRCSPTTPRRPDRGHLLAPAQRGRAHLLASVVVMDQGRWC